MAAERLRQTAPMRTTDVWAQVAAQRRELADRVESLEPSQWDAESWCTGWRVRDVLGHLVHLAEATQVSITRDVVRAGGRPGRALSKIARRLGERPVPGLADRLRAAAGGRFHVLGTPAVVALGEVVVHGADALRSVGSELDVPLPTPWQCWACTGVSDGWPSMELPGGTGDWSLPTATGPPATVRRCEGALST
ncbi:MAG: hypothetical protein QOK28_3390 [Actinomycetota bacterium]|jgi:hypothetical protein